MFMRRRTCAMAMATAVFSRVNSGILCSLCSVTMATS